MANNWPDGGEPPLTRREELAMGLLGAALVAVVFGGWLLITLRVFGPVSRPVGAAAASLAIAIALLWVRPWDTRPPRR
ncbi:MAG TPA: hypothetical protein VN157_15460 [Caulobacter sp.]|nr:hypothetical protein [Caulobacter sp.]